MPSSPRSRPPGASRCRSTDSVATEAGGVAIVAKALDAFGRVDVVINNAGVVRSAPFENHGDDLLWPVLESQIGGHFHVTRRGLARPARRWLRACPRRRRPARGSGVSRA